jgi:hypothetical protein
MSVQGKTKRSKKRRKNNLQTNVVMTLFFNPAQLQRPTQSTAQCCWLECIGGTFKLVLFWSKAASIPRKLEAVHELAAP